jgi:hypothetical protein
VDGPGKFHDHCPKRAAILETLHCVELHYLWTIAKLHVQCLKQSVCVHIAIVPRMRSY